MSPSSPNSPLPLAQHLSQAAQRLSAASETPRLDAELLLEAATGLGRATQHAHPERRLDSAQSEAFAALVARRARGEPLAYITGRCEFWSLELAVTPDVLIPRPETELLVEEALVRIPLDAPCTIADLGTGSGAIALALASERPRCHVTGVDASQRALAVARGNGAALALGNISWHLGHWFAGLQGLRFDVIVSNPPYVAADDLHLRQGGLPWEPAGALASGPHGLDDLRTITAAATVHLTPGGWLLVEHGWDQGEAVRGLFQAADFVAVSTCRDLAGHERVTLGRHP